MSGLLTKILAAPVKFPVVRGMLSYALIWPTCSIVQEYLEHGTSVSKANWARAARFSFFGTFFMAPVFYGWMKYSSRFFKRKDLMTAISRAAVEQVSYSPLAMAYFFFGMSMLEGKPYRACANEVREKFWPTYKIGMVFWPTAQTLNFYFVSEKNRIVFVSLASFVWTVYLAHMKGKKSQSDTFITSTTDKMYNMEPMSADMETSMDVESVIDNAPFVAGEISSDLIKQPVQVKGDLETPVLVVNTSEEVQPISESISSSEFNVPDLNAESSTKALVMEQFEDNYEESEEDEDEKKLNQEVTKILSSLT